MSRYDLVKEYNKYTRKRECYKEKLNINRNLRSELESRFETCINYRNKMEEYEGLSNIFDGLVEKNNERYSVVKKQEVLSMLNYLDTYLNNKITSIQTEINYWDSKITSYDEEEQLEESGYEG